jgi:short-subunit dehydrogenase
VREWIGVNVESANVEYRVADLNDKNQIAELVASIPRDLPLDLVQSVGLGAGTIQLENDNPYLAIDRVSGNLIEAELSVLHNTVALLQGCLPLFRQQQETCVCIVSSMSAVRSVVSGSVHMAAKAAISRFANAAMIELNRENIFITDVRPGIVDTGLYDDKIIRDTVKLMGQNYGYDYSRSDIFCAPPTAVAEAIVNVLISRAHITSINMVARGQWPHEGS